MKKFLSIFLAITLLISMTSVIGVYADEKVLLSESFENGKGEWKFGAGCKIVTENASDGKSCVYYIDDTEDGTPGVYSPAVKVSAGTEYTAVADFKAASGTVKLWLRFYDEADKNLATASATHSKGIATMVAPANAVKAQVFFAGNKATTGEAYIDNVRIIEGNASDIVTKPQTSTAVTTAPEVKPTESAASGTVVFAESFEEGSDNWKFNNSATTDKTAGISDEKASDGKYSAYIVDPDTGTYGYISNPISIEAGGVYLVSYDAFNVEGVGGKVFVGFFDKDLKRISSTAFAISGAGQWKSVSKSFTAPGNATAIRLYLTGASATTGKTYIDNIKIVKTGMAEMDADASTKMAEVTAKVAAAKPGDVIEIPDGIYSEMKITLSAKGTEAAPITIKAKNPGKVKITGESPLVVSGSYLNIEGLLFEGNTTQYVFRLDSSDHCVVKNCAFINCNPLNANGEPDTTKQQKWMYLVRGTYNTVSNCFFYGKASPGQMLEVIRTDGVRDYQMIEDCYFGGFAEGNVNGLETIRIGISGSSLTDSYTTVQRCFFEKCNGEVETISVKSGTNFMLNNTLYNNKGAITLRHGQGCLIEGNLVVGGEKTSVIAGVRVIGENHTVKNNYFYNLPETSTALYVSNGNPEPLIHEYYQVKNVDISNNSFINTDVAMTLGEYSPSDKNSNNKILPPKGKVYNNAIVSYKGVLPSIPNKEPKREMEMSGNYVSGKDIGYDGELPQGIEYKDIPYTIKDGYVSFEGGIGADIEQIKKAPKSPYDVMPSWVKSQYYDTKKITFTPVKGDPFNTDLTADKLLPKRGSIGVVINGYSKEFDVEPQLINSRTMVPMRAIFEEFGALVSWDEGTATATATSFGTEVKITENSDIAYVNGSEVKLDSPAVIINGRFLVPLRFVSESFGAEVGWIDLTQTAIIRYESKDAYNQFAKENDIKNPIYIRNAVQSGDDGTNSITNVIDGKLDTRWAVRDNLETKEPGYGIFDLGSVKSLDRLYISLGTSATRTYTYEIYVSEDGTNYTLAVEKTACEHPDGTFRFHELNGAKARYVKYVGYGNNENAWNNISEIVFSGK